MAIDESPVAIALREKRPVRGIEGDSRAPRRYARAHHSLPYSALRCVRKADRHRQHARRHQRAQEGGAGAGRSQRAARPCRQDRAGRKLLVRPQVRDDAGVAGLCSHPWLARRNSRDQTRRLAHPGTSRKTSLGSTRTSSRRSPRGGGSTIASTALFRPVASCAGSNRAVVSRTIATAQRTRIVGTNIDVTARKRAEAVLKESEARLADALAAGQVIAFEWDARTGQSRRSDNARFILGDEQERWRLARRASSSSAESIRDDRERFKAHIHELRPDNPSYALNFRFCGPTAVRSGWKRRQG